LDVGWTFKLNSAAAALPPSQAMANASQKRIGTITVQISLISKISSLISPASQNEQAIKNIRFGMIISSALSILLRLLFRRSSLPPSKGSQLIYIVTSLPAIFLARYLEKIGTTKRDPASGSLISSGEDLSQSGVTELCFDVLYVTCKILS
jgi:hypothetical protein